jgi:hypothetical protein
MELSKLFDLHIGATGGSDFLDSGSAARQAHSVYGSETQTAPLLATLFWNAYMATPQYQRALRQQRVATSSPAFVTAHGQGWPRYDLVVFTPTSQPVRHVPVEITRADLEAGWQRWSSRFSAQTARGGDPRLQRILPLGSSVVADVLVRMSPAMLFCPEPEALPTALVPSPAWAVEDPAAPGSRSTAGVLAYSQGRLGATAALHALAKAKAADVNGMPGRIRSRDPITDSCFIELEAAPPLPPRATRGPLRGLIPRQFEQVSFEGVASGRVGTVVTAWSPDLLQPVPGSQVKVLTRPVTAPGDSGAALLDPDDHVIGFAFYRTGFGADAEFAAWIWAASVFDAHGLSP